MPHCSSLRQLEHRVDSQPLVERKLSASMVIDGHRWLLSLPSTAHTRTATPSKSRACCQPVWPSASKSRVASPRSQNLLWREDYARTVIGWPNHRPTWSLSPPSTHCFGEPGRAAGQARPRRSSAHIAHIDIYTLRDGMLSPSVALLIHHNDLVACRRMAPPEDWRQVPRRPSPVWPSCVAILCGQPV